MSLRAVRLRSKFIRKIFTYTRGQTHSSEWLSITKTIWSLIKRGAAAFLPADLAIISAFNDRPLCTQAKQRPPSATMKAVYAGPLFTFFTFVIITRVFNAAYISYSNVGTYVQIQTRRLGLRMRNTIRVHGVLSLRVRRLVTRVALLLYAYTFFSSSIPTSTFHHHRHKKKPTSWLEAVIYWLFLPTKRARAHC